MPLPTSTSTTDHLSFSIFTKDLVFILTMGKLLGGFDLVLVQNDDLIMYRSTESSVKNLNDMQFAQIITGIYLLLVLAQLSECPVDLVISDEFFALLRSTPKCYHTMLDDIGKMLEVKN